MPLLLTCLSFNGPNKFGQKKYIIISITSKKKKKKNHRYSIKVKFTKIRKKIREDINTFHLLDYSFDHELYFMAFFKNIKKF